MSAVPNIVRLHVGPERVGHCNKLTTGISERCLEYRHFGADDRKDDSVGTLSTWIAVIGDGVTEVVHNKLSTFTQSRSIDER